MVFDLFNQQIPEKMVIKVTTKAKNERIKMEYTLEGNVFYKVYVILFPKLKYYVVVASLMYYSTLRDLLLVLL